MHNSNHFVDELVEYLCFDCPNTAKPRNVVRHFMETLEEKILNFENWSQPWTFYKFVSNDKTLKESELNLFNEIWTKAGGFELWNKCDLIYSRI